jgi:hypothetical protein
VGIHRGWGFRVLLGVRLWGEISSGLRGSCMIVPTRGWHSQMLWFIFFARSPYGFSFDDLPR